MMQIPRNLDEKETYLRNRHYDVNNIPHPFTGIQVTEHGFDILEQYIKDVRSIIGYDIPLAIGPFWTYWCGNPASSWQEELKNIISHGWRI